MNMSSTYHNVVNSIIRVSKYVYNPKFSFLLYFSLFSLIQTEFLDDISQKKTFFSYAKKGWRRISCENAFTLFLTYALLSTAGRFLFLL